jgi:thiol-disulfide isomerase/thioredoxin
MKFQTSILILLFLLLLSLVGSAQSPSAKIEKLKWNLVGENKKSTRQLEFIPPTGHHFNDKAPNKIESQNSKNVWVSAQSILVTLKKVEAKFNEDVGTCHVKGTLFICDDQNTYCVPKHEELNCGDEKNEKAKAENLAPINSKSTNLAPSESSGIFIDNHTKHALSEARSKGKPLFISFYGIWCPPCNQLEEKVFSQSEFKKLSSEFIMLKLDADSAESWELKSKYKVAGYPTVIFANENGDEINRLEGARDKLVFIKEMNRVLRDKNSSIDVKKKLAVLGDKNALRDLGTYFLNRREFADAHYYFSRLNLALRKNNDLVSATLGLYSKLSDEGAKLRYANLLQDSLSWFPHAYEALDRGSELAKTGEELDNVKLSQKGYFAQVATAQWFLAHPRELKNNEATKADLEELIGDSYTSLKDDGNSKKFYKLAAKSFLNQIEASGLNAASERAFNLERIYCIWKSGDVAGANEWYEKLEHVYPSEFTFYNQQAKLLLGEKRFSEALEKSNVALKYAYGDNKLRVTAVNAQILKELKKISEAKNVIDQTLTEVKLPSDSSIRTYRYVDALKTLRATL